MFSVILLHLLQEHLVMLVVDWVLLLIFDRVQWALAAE